MQKGLPALAISAVTRNGTVELLRTVRARLQSLPIEPLYEVEIPVIRPVEDENLFEIARDAGRFRICGVRVERMGAVTDWENDEGVARFQRILKALGLPA